MYFFLVYLGSDCTSSFYGKGKATAWKILIGNPQFVDTFSLLGSSFPLSDNLARQLEKFTCLLYGDKSSSSVNECRYALFKAEKCSDEVLPPTRDSFLKHVERAKYQAGIWSRSLTAKMTIPSPIGNGGSYQMEELKSTG